MVQRNRVIISGRMGDAENWSTGFTFVETETGAIVVDQVGLQSWADAIAASIDTIVTSDLLNMLSTSAAINQVTVQSYPPSGPVSLQAVAPIDDLNGSTSSVCPFQTACVLSLRTGLPGASFRGRNYWPALGVPVSGSGTWTTTVAQSMADDFAVLAAGIQDAATMQNAAALQVYSPTRDLVTPVTSILCGTVPDTQRRRRDNLVEDYFTAEYPPA